MMIVAWTSSQNESLTKGKRDKKMKTTIKLMALIGAVGALAATNAFASMSVTIYQDTSNYSTGSGGEFRAYGNTDLNNAIQWSAYSAATSGGPNTYFQTFCAELHEHVSLGTPFDVSSIGNNVLYDNTGVPVPITMGVAYLYSKFAAGTLTGYDYTYGAGRSSTAGDLQQAIWTLLGEQGTPLAAWVTTALNGSGIANWYAAANGAYGVQAMILGAPGQYQDQLVIVPEASTLIAGALLLLPLGVSALRIVRKNRVA